MKKLIFSPILGVTLSGAVQAQVTVTADEKREFLNAVESSVFSQVNYRNNVLALLSGYVYENKDPKNLSLDEIKFYSVSDAKVMQCIVDSVTPQAFKKPLTQSFDAYLKQVNQSQFDADKAFITDPKRQQFYRLQQEIAKIYASITPIPNPEFSNEPVPKGAKEEIDKKMAQIEKLSNQISDEEWAKFMSDGDKLMQNMGAEDEAPNDHSALGNLLGLSIANIPFSDEKTLYPASSMSIYSQTVLDNCHKPLWQKVYDENHTK